MRAGDVSEDTHAFVHGLPTSVVGSYSTGQKKSWCPVGCSSLHEQAERLGPTVVKEYILKNECATCRQEREVRQLVAAEPGGLRFHEQKLREAPCNISE